VTFTYRLEQSDGSPGDPATFRSAVPNWRPGDPIHLGGGRTLRVVDVRPVAGDDDEPVLVVESAASEPDAA
jgi:hypothetical protein